MRNRHYDNDAKKVLETVFSFPVVTNADGFSYNGIVKQDVKEVRMRADNDAHGMQKAIAALHSSNSKQQEGSLPVIGNPYLVAGNNVEVTGLGKLSGIYHIHASVHHETPEGGYFTRAEVKRVGYVDVVKTKRKKPKKQKPVTVSVVH